MKIYYMATVTKNGKYTVYRDTDKSLSAKPMGDIRKFDTYEQADECAKELAAGKFPELADPGIYISNR